jgi:hypothetical protein
MATNIRIPGTITDLKRGLGAIEGLLTAKRWERAAIVYAWTDPGSRGGDRRANSVSADARMTPTAFANLGIRGLGNWSQVNDYREAWESAAAEIGNDDMLAVQPGDAVEMPNLPWKEHFGEPTADVQARVAKSYIAANPEVVQQAVETFPAVAAAATKGLDNVAKKTATPATHTPHVPAPFDYDRSVMEGFNAITSALFSLNRDVWSPNANSEQCLRLLRLALNDWADGQPVSIHDEIDTFLKSLTH